MSKLSPPPSSSSSASTEDIILMSPTEPEFFTRAFHRSSLPEQYGSDFAFCDRESRVIGIQRKTISDLISSLHDGRLSSGLLKMDELDFRYLIIEGKKITNADGDIVLHRSKFTAAQLTGVICSLQIVHSCAVMYSDSMTDTSRMIMHLHAWHRKSDHGSLLSRPKKGSSISRVDKAMHFLQGFPGVGYTLARKIATVFGGAPLQIIPGVESRLRAIVGESRMEKIMTMLSQVIAEETSNTTNDNTTMATTTDDEVTATILRQHAFALQHPTMCVSHSGHVWVGRTDLGRICREQCGITSPRFNRAVDKMIAQKVLAEVRFSEHKRKILRQE